MIVSLTSFALAAPPSAALPTRDELAALGPARTVSRDDGCACLRVVWESGGVVAHELAIPLTAVRAIEERPTGAEREIVVGLADGEILAMRAPCLLAHHYAGQLASAVGVPLVGDASACAAAPGGDAVLGDGRAPVGPPDVKLTWVDHLDVALASLETHGRDEDAAHAFQRVLMPSRGTLAHCFTRADQSGAGRYRVVLDETGAIGRVKAVGHVTEEVDACVVTALGAARAREAELAELDGRQRLVVTVGFEPAGRPSP